MPPITAPSSAPRRSSSSRILRKRRTASEGRDDVAPPLLGDAAAAPGRAGFARRTGGLWLTTRFKEKASLRHRIPAEARLALLRCYLLVAFLLYFAHSF